MKFSSLMSCCAGLVITLFASSCSSSGSSKKEGTTRTDASGQRLAQRLGKWDTTKRSSFDKHRSAGETSKDYKTREFNQSKDYAGAKKQFNSGKDGFKTKSFAQSNKKSRAADKTFAGAGKKNRMAGQKFETSESRFSNQANRDSDKRSSMEGDVFRTQENRETQKAMASNKRPYIEQTQKPGYTEDEVKGLLNK